MKMFWKYLIAILAATFYCGACYCGGTLIGTKLGTWLFQEE